MKAKQLLVKLARMHPDAVVYLEANGVWQPLSKVEEGAMTDNRTKRTDHVVRLQAKRTR